MIVELLQKGLHGLLPLLPLTREGRQHETIDSMIEAVIASRQMDLLPLSEIIAGLVWKDKTEQEWLRRRFAMFEDLLEDSWVYQEILNKGIGKGMKQGIEQEALRLRQTLYTIIQKRFPALIQNAPLQLEHVSQPEELQELIIKISLAQGIQEAQLALDAIKGDTL